MPEKGKRIGGTKPGGFESCLITPTDSEIRIEDLLSIVNLQAGHARELRLSLRLSGVSCIPWQLTHARELRPLKHADAVIVIRWQPTHTRELRQQKPPKIAIIFDV